MTKKSSDFILEDLDVENDNHHPNRLIRFYTEPIQPLLEFGYFKKVEKLFPNYYSLKRQLMICLVVYTHTSLCNEQYNLTSRYESIYKRATLWQDGTTRM